jgi:chromosome segregation ATPase
MPDDYATLTQRRTALLDQMAALDRMERGRLSEQFLHGLKDGRKVTWGPYYVLQRRRGRQIVKKRVPADRLAAVQADIRRHEEFQQLAQRYAEITEEMTRLEDARPELKKKPPPFKPIISGRRRHS